MRAKLVVLTNFKGGVLKSSIANAIGSIHSQQGHKSLIIDLDAQSNQRFIYGLKRVDVGLYEVLMKEKHIKDCLIKINDNLDILPSNYNMNFFTSDILTNVTKYPNYLKLLSEAVEPIMDKYSLIVFDCPPSFDLITLNAYHLPSAQLVIPTSAEGFSVDGLTEVVQVINDIREDNPTLRIAGLVITLFKKNTLLHKNMAGKIKKFAAIKSLKLYETKISDSVKVSESVMMAAKPIVESNPNHKVSKEFFKLYDEVITFG